jgi:hypothetical protein
MAFRHIIKRAFFRRRGTDKLTKAKIEANEDRMGPGDVFSNDLHALRGSKYERRFKAIFASKHLSDREIHRELGMLFGEISSVLTDKHDRTYALKAAKEHMEIAQKYPDSPIRRRNL